MSFKLESDSIRMPLITGVINIKTKPRTRIDFQNEQAIKKLVGYTKKKAGSSNGKAGGGIGAGLIRNLMRSQQVVAKRVYKGGCKSKTELGRQVKYIMNPEKDPNTWSNTHDFIMENVDKSEANGIVDNWSNEWAGQPKYGHTDHLVISFPPNTDRDTALLISKEWAENIFQNKDGEFPDRWKYLASFHNDTDHPHCHFIVNKLGIEDRTYWSLTKKGYMNYDVMKDKAIEIAATHGIWLNNSSRISRGVLEPAISPQKYRKDWDKKKLNKSREPSQKALIDVRRRENAKQYRDLANVVGTIKEMFIALPKEVETQDNTLKQMGAFVQLETAANWAADLLERGEPLMFDKNQKSIDKNAVNALEKGIEKLDEGMSVLQNSIREGWKTCESGDDNQDRFNLEIKLQEISTKYSVIYPNDKIINNLASNPVEKNPYQTIIHALKDVATDATVKKDLKLAIKIESMKESAILGFLKEVEPRKFGIHERMMSETLPSKALSKSWIKRDGEENVSEKMEQAQKILAREVGQHLAKNTDLAVRISARISESQADGNLKINSTNNSFSELRQISRDALLAHLGEDNISEINKGNTSSLDAITPDQVTKNFLAAELAIDANIETPVSKQSTKYIEKAMVNRNIQMVAAKAKNHEIDELEL